MSKLIKTVTNGGYPFAVATGAVLLLLSGCATVSEDVDIASERRDALTEDMQRWEEVQAPIGEAPLTLKQAIAVGLANNLELRAADFEREVARDDSLARRLEMLPDLNLGVVRDKRNPVARQDYIRADTGAKVQSNVISSFRNSTRGQLELTWSVLDFGLSYVRARQASYQEIALDMRRARQSQLLALDITDAYWRAALAEDALDYMRSVEKQLREQKAQIELSVSESRVDPIEAKSAARRLVEIEISIRDLQAAISNARIDLARLTGMRLGQKFKLAREPMRPILSALPRLKQLDVHTLEQFALLNRPELYEADVNQRIRQDDVKAAMLSMFPDLTFGLGAHYDDNRLLRDRDWTRVSAALSWNLLDLPARYAMMNGRKDAVEVGRFQRLQTMAAVIAQVHLGMLDYAVKVDRFVLRDESAQLSTDLLAMYEENRRSGRANSLQVTEQLLEDLSARLRRDQAVIEVLVAYRRMLVSLGLDVEYWDTELAAVCLPDFGTHANKCLMQSNRVASKPIKAPVAPVQPTAPGIVPANENAVGADVSAAQLAVLSLPPAKDRQWVVYVGVYANPDAIPPVVAKAQSLAPNQLAIAEPVTELREVGATVDHRVGFKLPNRESAYEACSVLKSRNMDCWVTLANYKTVQYVATAQ